MEVSTFNDDLLDLSAFATRLETFLKVERLFVTGSLVVALNSKFGFGKSTFLKMWKAEIECRNSADEKPLVIALNAWESDYYGDPLFAIISGLAKSMESNGRSTTTLINAAKDVGWFATAIGGQISRKFTGVDPVAAGAIAEKKRAERDEIRGMPLDAFSSYEHRKDAMRHLQNTIKLFVTNSNSNVLFLVDELDRCRPDYAINYLENIKHIFDVEGATFVLAADRQHLENSAKSAFGSDLDFDEYYRKFVHREVTLPPISELGYRNLASKYVTHYLERDGVRNCYMNIESNNIERIVELVESLKLTPRQIQEMFRILGHIFDTQEELKGRLLWCVSVGSMVMAAFKVGNPKAFHHFGNSQFEPQEAVNFLTDLFKSKRIEWWFRLFLTGGGLKVGEDTSDQEVMKDVGFIAKDEDLPYRDDLHQWHNGWGRSSKRFFQIHEKIEQVSQWT